MISTTEKFGSAVGKEQVGRNKEDIQKDTMEDPKSNKSNKEKMRQSDRLISLGYYNQERPPYKEKIQKVFPRKKRPLCFPRPFVLEPTLGEITAPHSETMRFITSDDAHWDTHSNASRTSFAGERETVMPEDQSAASLGERGDQPAPNTAETPKVSNHDEQTPNKFWPKGVVCLLAATFFSLTLFGLCRTQPFTLPPRKTSPSQSVKDIRAHLIQIRAHLMQMQEDLAHMRSLALPKGLSMPNFALESQGARILHANPSERYRTSSQPPLVTFWNIPVFYPHHSPRTVIQDHTTLLVPGRCWSFAGQNGKLFISLSEPVRVSHVTLGHISRDHAPYGFLHSAPHHFSVSGYLSEDGEGTLLGEFEYDPEGESFQTFELPGHNRTFRNVLLEILSNWGHPDYTCVYSFKVHGDVKL